MLAEAELLLMQPSRVIGWESFAVDHRLKGRTCSCIYCCAVTSAVDGGHTQTHTRTQGITAEGKVNQALFRKEYLVDF